MNKRVSLFLFTLGAAALAAPPRPGLPGGDRPGIAPPPPLVRIGGSVTVSGCNPNMTDLIVRISGLGNVTANNKTTLADGSVRLTYSRSIPVEQVTGNYTVTPTFRAGVCTGGRFSPGSQQVTRLPATNVNFTFAVQGGKRHHIRATEFAAEVNRQLATMKARFNNHQTQSSFVEVRGFRFPFTIPRVTVDLDCGTLCPDLGDAHFYVNDVNLQRATFSFAGGSFSLVLSLEDAGREIKGYHSKLGDNGVPDFQVDNGRLSLRAMPKLDASSRLSLGFSNPNLSANIESTGGCNIAGIDLCNKIFGSDRKIQKGVESAAVAAMNGNLVQNGLATGLAIYLQSRNINGPLVRAYLSGSDLILEER